MGVTVVFLFLFDNFYAFACVIGITIGEPLVRVVAVGGDMEGF
jgi:hypothetical protein